MGVNRKYSATENQGCQVWKTIDGENWELFLDEGLGNPRSTRISQIWEDGNNIYFCLDMFWVYGDGFDIWKYSFERK